jgi:bifunctional DNA-binding transcriptional regulator/antitoxin component of YhaV-PrlF toxin-antitoxin module
MTITRLKTKNQITLPKAIVKRLKLKKDELFQIDVEGNYLKLTPVEMTPKYSAKDLKTIDKIVKKEKRKARLLKDSSELAAYIEKIK